MIQQQLQQQCNFRLTYYNDAYNNDTQTHTHTLTEHIHNNNNIYNNTYYKYNNNTYYNLNCKNTTSKLYMDSSNLSEGTAKYRYRISRAWVGTLANANASSHHLPICTNTNQQSQSQQQQYIQTNDGHVIEGEVLAASNASNTVLQRIILQHIRASLRTTKPSHNHLNFNLSQPTAIHCKAVLNIGPPTRLSSSQFAVAGTILQPIINLKEGYDCIYDSLTPHSVTNFTVVNKHGRIQWPDTIHPKLIDFQAITIQENQVSVCGRLQEYDMLATLNSLPSAVMKVAHDRSKACQKMAKYIQRVKHSTKENIRLVSLDLENKTYTFKVAKHKQLNVDVNNDDNKENDALAAKTVDCMGKQFDFGLQVPNPFRK